MLAPVSRVARGGRLAAAARAAAREAQRGGSDQLVAGSDRQLARAGCRGGTKTGPSPVDRSRSGSKHHLIACGRGTPLACSLTGGNRNDIIEMIPLLDAIPPVRGRRAVRAAGRASCMAIALTTRARVGASSAAVASRPRSPGRRAPRLRPRQEAMGGRENDRLPAPVPAGCASATSAATTSTKPSSRSAAA